MSLRYGCLRRARHCLSVSRVARLLAAGLLPAVLAACGSAQTVGRSVPPFEEDIVAFLEEEIDDDVERERLLIGYIDLNEDGGDEAFALYLQEDNCTGSACGGWIFQRTARTADLDEDERASLAVVGRYASFSLPVASGQRRTNGWKDVIVRDPATGRDDRLRYDGRVYR